jgi:hypothetical protein
MERERRMRTHLSVLILSAVILAGFGCDRAYDTTLETFGKSKKDTLVDRIAAARDAQSQTKEQFALALDEFRAIVGYKGTLLEDKYKELKGQYEQCQAQTTTVESRLLEVRRAAKSLFRQWEDEMEEFSSSVARKSSEEKLKQMQIRYDAVINAMEKVCDKFYPALSAFKDQVLLIKHHINAQSEVSSGGELAVAEREISLLTQEIDRAMAQADSFIRQMRLE